MRGPSSRNGREEKEKKDENEDEHGRNEMCVEIYLDDTEKRKLCMFLMCVLSHDGFLSARMLNVMAKKEKKRRGCGDSVRKDNGNIISKP